MQFSVILYYKREIDAPTPENWEMVVRGKTNKSLPLPTSGIERKNELKLFGVTLNENPCNWDTHIDSLLQKAGSRM